MRLGVNIDHVATIRELRGTEYPDPVEAALLAESAGADGITAHIRMDRRHIKERDIRLLGEVVKTHLNVEASLDKDIQKFIMEIKPDWVCIVPEREEEITTEGGLNISAVKSELQKAIERMKNNGIKTTLFIEPDKKIIEQAAEMNVDAIEINTSDWSEEQSPENFKKIEEAAQFGIVSNMEVHAGHGLNLQNVGPVATIEEINELNIGHAIISRAVTVGMERAVTEMKEKMFLAE